VRKIGEGSEIMLKHIQKCLSAVPIKYPEALIRCSSPCLGSGIHNLVKEAYKSEKQNYKRGKHAEELTKNMCT
jgi:hypothetical protein